MVDDTFVSTSPTAPLIAFVCPRPNGHMGAQVTAVGCLAAPCYSSSWYITVIGTAHQQSAVPTLFAGFHTRNELPRPMRSFAGFESGANHFCLGRAGTTCAFEVLCTSAVLSGLFDRVL